MLPVSGSSGAEASGSAAVGASQQQLEHPAAKKARLDAAAASSSEAAASKLGAQQALPCVPVSGQRSVMAACFASQGFTRSVNHNGFVQALGPVQTREGALGCRHSKCGWRCDRPSAMASHERHCDRRPNGWLPEPEPRSLEDSWAILARQTLRKKAIPEEADGDDPDYVPQPGDADDDGSVESESESEEDGNPQKKGASPPCCLSRPAQPC